MKNREEKILIAGSGGQGVMLLGKIIAQAAVLEDKKVTYLRSYGAAMRGGTANCWVKVSAKEISTPIFGISSVSIILNAPSLKKFGKKIEPQGWLIMNSSVADKHIYSGPKVKVKSLPLNTMALELGNIKIANVIALGCLIKEKPFIKISSVERVMERLFLQNQTTLDRKILEQNKKALEKGFYYD
jgi:2-oxoglutarate ferredoxin oxidoreductase subunit gamma